MLATGWRVSKRKQFEAELEFLKGLEDSNHENLCRIGEFLDQHMCTFIVVFWTIYCRKLEH